MQHPLLRLVALSFVAAGLSARPVEAAQVDAAAPRERSVLFYLMDTCRGDRVGYDRYERETTPFLEWLAERSVVFENCYSQAPWTKPSMAAMLTSQYPSTTGVYKMDQRLPAESVTWPEVLRANGMYTAGFSANVVMGNLLSNFAQGFDLFTESTAINRGDSIRFASGSAKKLNTHAFAWLDETDHWPMLLYMHSVDPHEEYEPEPEYLKRFAHPERHAQFRDEWQKLLRSRPDIPGLFVTQDNFDRTSIDSASFIEHASNLYDADILANDDQLQVLWDKLQKDGWGEDLILVFTSDHGDEFFEHGGTSHGYSLYDEMLHIPLMIYAPGLLPAGKRIATPVRSIDIYPTLCELLAIDAPAGLEGTSLVPLATGAEAPGVAAAREIWSEHREDPLARVIGQGSGLMVSVRSGSWKFILNEKPTQLLAKPRVELYDVDADPGETNNLADARPDIARAFEVKARTFIANQWEQADTNDTTAMDPEVLEQLRALGYVGDEDAEPTPDVWVPLRANDIELVRAALDAGADPNALEPTFGMRPLSWSAMTGNVPFAKALLAAGAGVDDANRDGSTPLMGAAFLGRIEVLELLMDRGADPMLTSAIGDDALASTRVAVSTTDYIANLLGIPLDWDEVAAGRELCAELLGLTRTESSPTSRLFDAVRSGDTQAVDAALSDGANANDPSAENGRTPLFVAALHGNVGVVRLLLERSAKVDARNTDGSSVLLGAALGGEASIVALLIERGADVDARDPKGATPLHAAAFLGRVHAAEALLDAGADPLANDADGRAPIEMTRIDWQGTAYVLGVLGLDIERTVVEAGRSAVEKLLR